ncbi:MAG: hypothetical protein ACLRYY_03550 [Anaerobutyricum soehngenii]
MEATRKPECDVEAGYKSVGLMKPTHELGTMRPENACKPWWIFQVHHSLRSL